MMIFKSARYSMVVLSVILFGGCSLGEHKLNNNVTLPQNYMINETQKINISQNWWEEFGIDELNLLVSKALTNSPDILMLVEKIVQARLEYDISDASDLNINISGSTGTNTKSDTDGNKFPTTKNTKANLNISYELDLIDKIFDPTTKKAKADFNITKYDVQTSQISLISNIVTTYMQWLLVNKKIEIAKENLQIAQEIYDIIEVKYKNGLVNMIDISKQKSSLLSQESSLVALEHQKKQIKNSLAILVGETPQGFELSYDNSVLNSIKIPDIGSGVPSDLLLRRPDIASSLEKIQSQEATIQSAKIARWPSLKLNLSNSLEMTKTALFTLANPAVNTSIVTLSVAQSIFDGGKLKNQERIAISKGDEVIQSYKKIVLTALKEVEDTISSLSQYDKQLKLQEQIYDHTKSTLQLSKLRYKEGILDYSSLLDSQKSYFQADEQLIQQKLNYISSIVELHKVLGGGWEKDI